MSLSVPVTLRENPSNKSVDRARNAKSALHNLRKSANYTMRKFDPIDVTNHQIHLAR